MSQATPDKTSLDLQSILERLRAGDKEAHEALLQRIWARLHGLISREMRKNPKVRRWEETDDVMQRTMLQLARALQDVHPKSLAELYGLCWTLIRRELIDLSRHYYGPLGSGKHHASQRPGGSGDTGGPGAKAADSAPDPLELAQWTEFHEQVERLPQDQREVFNLLYYEQMTQGQAAQTLGVPIKRVSQLWKAARDHVRGAMAGP